MATIFIQGNGLNGRTWIGSGLLTTGERSEGLMISHHLLYEGREPC